MQKTYSRINWENYPSENTPLNESNLNRIDYATNEIDDRVIALDTQKASVQEISALVSSISVDDMTGEITITKYNGSTVVIQTTLNKIAINWRYDPTTQTIILVQNDGTEVSIDLSSLIQNNEFDDTPTIDFTVKSDGHVSAIVVEHSIGDEHLRTDYLADIRVAEANAAASESNAEAFKQRAEAWADGEKDGTPVSSSDVSYNNNAKFYKRRSEAWAVGKQDGSPVDVTDETYENNSKFYAEVTQTLKDDVINIKSQAQNILDQATARLTGLSFMLNFVDGCLYYDINVGLNLQVDDTTGNLMWEVIT